MPDPIAALLGLAPAADKNVISINGEMFELYPARGGNTETMYRVNPGHGVSNPGFSLHLTPPHQQQITLGQYLARPRDGVRRAEAEQIVAAARTELAA